MGVTPRNSFSRETRTQDKVDGQLQQKKKKLLCHSPLCQQRRHSHHQFEELHIMRAFLIFALAASATAQLKFGSDPTEAPKKDVNTRLGLLGTSLGLSPTAEQTSSGFTQGSSSGQTPTGRVPSGGEVTGSFSQCCCVPLNEQCGDPLGRDIDYDYDLVGSGLIDPRLKPLREEAAKKTQKAKDGLGLRIVNRPNANTCPLDRRLAATIPLSTTIPLDAHALLLDRLQVSLRVSVTAATRELWIRASSAEQGTSQHLLVVSSTERPVLASSPGLALFSTRTMTSLEAVLSFPTTAATTMDEAQERLSLLLASSRMSSRTSKSLKQC